MSDHDDEYARIAIEKWEAEGKPQHHHFEDDGSGTCRACGKTFADGRHILPKPLQLFTVTAEREVLYTEECSFEVFADSQEAAISLAQEQLEEGENTWGPQVWNGETPDPTWSVREGKQTDE